MSFSAPPRRVPVTVLFNRIAVLLVILVLILFVPGLFAPVRNDPDVMAKWGCAGSLILFLIVCTGAVVLKGRKYLALVREGEVVNARLVSCRITYESNWFPIEDFAQHWQPYHGPSRPDRSAFVVESVDVECEFEFRARGNVVRGRDKMKMNLHVAERAVEPVIFLPSNPQVCRLVKGLPLNMQIQLVDS